MSAGAVVVATTDSTEPFVWGPFADLAAAERAIPQVRAELRRKGWDEGEEIEITARPLRALEG